MTGTNLNFDTGTITLYVQGDPSRKFSFNPTDQKVLKGFLRLVDEAEEKMKDFSKRAEGIEIVGSDVLLIVFLVKDRLKLFLETHPPLLLIVMGNIS